VGPDFYYEAKKITDARGVLMKRCVLFLAVITLTISTAYAADDPVTRAMKLYEKRHYEDAAAVIRSELPAIDPARQGAALLALGMAYLKNAELYRALHEESVAAAQDYLKRISTRQGKDRSRFADLYLGQALIEAGKPGPAASLLEKFIADESLDPLYRAIAKADLGLSYYLNDDKQKANDVWNSVDAPTPEVSAELASAYSKAGLKEKNSVALCDQILADVKKSGKPLSIRLVKNIISVYARAGLTDKGLEVLKRADAKAYSYREVLGKSKIISFYDSSFLGDVSSLYGQASIASLEKAASDAAMKDAAEYYLIAAYSLFCSADQAAKIAGAFASSKLPQQQKDRIRVRQAEHQFRNNRQAEAARIWSDLSQKQPIDPDLLGEILFACVRTKAECGTIVKQAESAVETGQGKRFFVLNYALGKYYLVKNNRQKALSYMEAGRDKSNKNKIESNDPLMLVDLAGLYYRNKKFSEALEIYFEMSKQFPAVRQIQDAMQGVYAMEQKSAGDVKIF
jgi:hypothetical protein